MNKIEQVLILLITIILAGVVAFLKYEYLAYAIAKAIGR